MIDLDVIISYCLSTAASWRLPRIRSCLVALATALFGLFATSLAAAPYLLGPEDKLKIKVYEWRAATGEAHEWEAVTGEFAVAASGELPLPLIGEIKAAGRTTSELSIAIAEKLQAKIGLSKRPDASVEVFEYRPIYVTGLVSKPGQYPYKPDLTTLQAVAVAGGVLKLTDMSLLGFERDTLVSRGDLRVLAAENLSLQARQARLDAEYQGIATITFPADLTQQKSMPDVARSLREEQLLFEARRRAITSQRDALAQTKALLANEIQTLRAKSVSLQRQLDLASRELDNVNSLVSKGLSVSSRQLALEQSKAQFESNRLDIDLIILRAQQDFQKTDRDDLDLQNKFRNDVLTELSDVRNKMALNRERSSTAQALVFNSEVQAPQAAMAQIGGSDPKLQFTIIRRVNGQSHTIAATDIDAIEPGDVLRVERQPRSASSGGQTADVKEVGTR